MDTKTALFQSHRPRLFGLTYRMLGTPADAEDVLHDTWLRWHAQAVEALDDPEAWLVTVTTRLALDRLRRARNERAAYTGPWLPEPTEAVEAPPGEKLERAESLHLSFLALLERLSADERAAFLLHDVFDYSHAEAAAILGIREDACRQRVKRATTRLREGRPRFHVDTHLQQRLLERFAAAMAHPDLSTLKALFAEDAVHLSDGGGIVRAALRPLLGGERIARLYLQIARSSVDHPLSHSFTLLNGAPALLSWNGTTLVTALWIDTDGDRITAVHALRHPEKLARLLAVTRKEARASLY